VLVGAPAWANHAPILEAASLPIVWYDHFDPATQAVCFDQLMTALQTAAPGSLVLLQASCHNPTGVDLDLEQWRAVCDVVVERGLLPFLDVAYPGLGAGMDADMAGVRLMLSRAPEAIVAVSGAKSFGLYRERVGALFILARSGEAARRALSNALGFARVSYSMPPDHGAAVVRLVLQTPELAEDWARELESIRVRIVEKRRRFADAAVAAGLPLGPLARQAGMFSTLPLSLEEVLRLRDEHAVYMTDAARINVAALTSAKIDVVVDALAQVAAARATLA
jgi:aromatic-amino-acid transaminase